MSTSPSISFPKWIRSIRISVGGSHRGNGLGQSLIASAGVSLKAYFYSAEGKLIHTAKEPSQVNARNGSTVPIPVSYDAGKKYSFFFGIPGAIQKGPDKWKRVIVVFGKGE